MHRRGVGGWRAPVACAALMLCLCGAAWSQGAEDAAAAEPASTEPSSVPPDLMGTDELFFEKGGASWYGIGLHRRRTASGERFDMNALTAAHRTLPFGTQVCVHSLVTGREVLVRINDRGPHSAGRIIDLSRAAAQALGLLDLGIKQVALSLPELTGRPCAADSR